MMSTVTRSMDLNVSKISETKSYTDLDDIRHEAVIIHDDPVIAAKSFSSHAHLNISAVEYTEDENSTAIEADRNEEQDLIGKVITKYAALLTNWRSSLCIVLGIFFVVVVCAVYSLTEHPIPDFSDPSKGFEARGTLISKRLISVHHLVYAASLPNSLITQPNVLAIIGTTGRHMNDYEPRDVTSQATTHLSGTSTRPSTQLLKTSSGAVAHSEVITEVTEAITTTSSAAAAGEVTESATSDTTATAGESATHGVFRSNHIIKGLSDGTEQSSEIGVTSNATMTSRSTATQGVFRSNQIKVLNDGSEQSPEISVIYDRQRRLSNIYTEQCLTIDENYAGFVFKSNTDDTNLFTKDGIQSICRWQRRVHKRYYNNFQSCTLLSVADFVLHLNNKVTCEEITEGDVQTTRDLLADCSNYYYRSSLRRNCATRRCDVPPKCSQLNAVYDMLHYLTDRGFYNRINETRLVNSTTYLTSSFVFIPLILGKGNDSILYQILDEEFNRKKVVENGASKIVAIKLDKYDVFFHYFWRDTFLVGGSASCIVFVIWFYSKSLFITGMTLLNFVLSLALAYFTYIVIVQVEFFPFLAVTTGLLIVAIGADDTFVFLEIWNESRECEKDRLNAMARTLRHALPTMFVTSLTTSSAFFINIISPITAVRCFGLYAGTAILFNFLLTLSWLPSVVILNDAIQQLPSRQRRTSCPKSLSLLSAKITTIADVLFKIWIPHMVIKLRFIWIVLFSFMGLAGAFVIFVSPGLQLPRSNFPVFDDTNMIEVYETKYQELFRFENDGGSGSILNMQFIWGVTPADTGDYWNPDDRGHLVFDTPLEFNPDVQKWMLDFCRSVRTQDFYEPSSNSRHENCFMETFVEYMSRDCSPVPDKINDLVCCGMHNYTSFDVDTFKMCLPLALREYPNLKDYIFYDNGSILGARVQFPSNYTFSRMYTTMNEYWSDVNSWSDAELSTAPAGLSGGWFITDYNMIQLYFYDLQKSLVKSGSFSLLSSISLAAVVLFIVTRNVLLSTFAMLSIMGTIFVTIGSLVLLGWELNVMESVIFSLAVGLSVDFTIHYGVAYRLAPYPDRESRVGFSIRSLASAITMAAFSTFVPGACMFPAISLIYQQMGVFLTLIMSVSWMYSTFFFQSLCYVIGPQENACELAIPCCNAKDEVSIETGAKETNLVVVQFKS